LPFPDGTVLSSVPEDVKVSEFEQALVPRTATTLQIMVKGFPAIRRPAAGASGVSSTASPWRSPVTRPVGHCLRLRRNRLSRCDEGS
jgi:hypothetical protein